MKTLYWTYSSIVASFVLLLSIWGVVGEVKGDASPNASLVSLAVPEFSLSSTEAKGRAGVYEAAASLSDIARYRAIARYSTEKDWQKADEIMAKLENRALVGHFLAARYTDKHYTPSLLQLKLWFAHNDYLPQASTVLRRMQALYPKEARSITLPISGKPLRGYNDASRAKMSLRAEDNELWRSGFASLGSGFYSAAYQTGITIIRNSKGESQHGNWLAGLAAWHLNDIKAAARHFTAMAESDHVGGQYRAAAAFWAQRAYLKLGDDDKAEQYLKLAAQEPHSFYGMLAAAERGDAVWHPDSASDFTDNDDWEDFVLQDEVQQVVLLHAIGQEEAAERLLRHRYFSFDREEREQLTQLAQTLGMASVVLPMARYAGSDNPALHAALYPIPQWRDRLRADSDHALVLAIVKQESGFNPKAGSPKGAQGLMQILPSTARYIRRQKGVMEIKTAGMGNAGLESLPTSWDLMDPSYNLTIGQAYLRYLSDKPYIDGNLIYLLAAYNAGAAPLLRWQDRAGMQDPLLFIESMPFVETRNYVKNVLRNYWIYQAMLEGNASPRSLVRLSEDRWPLAG